MGQRDGEYKLRYIINSGDFELEFDPQKGKFIAVYNNRRNEDIFTDLSMRGFFL